MPAVPEPTPLPATGVSTLPPPQKLAMLLTMLGAEGAAQILKHLEEREVEAVTAEMARLGAISQEAQTEVLREFGQVVVETATAVRGGADFAQTVLEKGLGAPKAAAVLTRLNPSRLPAAGLQQLTDLEPGQLYNLLKRERAQTIALVASCLPPVKAAQLLALLPADQRESVVERLAMLGPTPVEMVEKVIAVLLQKAGPSQPRVLSQTGGLKTAALVLNGLDKRLSQSLLSGLEERNPELGQAIRQKMFTFEDLVRLDAAALQRVLREVDLRDLAIALKRASEQLKTVLLGAISKRAAETVNEEMGYLGAIKLRDIEAAQVRIIAVLRRLETEGEIQLDDTEETDKPDAAM